MTRPFTTISSISRIALAVILVSVVVVVRKVDGLAP